MKKNWFKKEIEEFSKLSGYKKPEKYSNIIKLDSNENYAIDPEFVSSLIEKAKSKVDVREYPLGGTERLVNSLSQYLNLPPDMI